MTRISGTRDNLHKMNKDIGLNEDSGLQSRKNSHMPTAEERQAKKDQIAKWKEDKSKMTQETQPAPMEDHVRRGSAARMKAEQEREKKKELIAEYKMKKMQDEHRDRMVNDLEKKKI